MFILRFPSGNEWCSASWAGYRFMEDVMEAYRNDVALSAHSGPLFGATLVKGLSLDTLDPGMGRRVMEAMKSVAEATLRGERGYCVAGEVLDPEGHELYLGFVGELLELINQEQQISKREDTHQRTLAVIRFPSGNEWHRPRWVGWYFLGDVERANKDDKWLCLELAIASANRRLALEEKDSGSARRIVRAIKTVAQATIEQGKQYHLVRELTDPQSQEHYLQSITELLELISREEAISREKQEYPPKVCYIQFASGSEWWIPCWVGWRLLRDVIETNEGNRWLCLELDKCNRQHHLRLDQKDPESALKMLRAIKGVAEATIRKRRRYPGVRQLSDPESQEVYLRGMRELVGLIETEEKMLVEKATRRPPDGSIG